MVANRIRVNACIFAIIVLVAASVSAYALQADFENGVGKNAEAIGSDIDGLVFCAVNAATLQPSGNDVLYADIDSGWYSVTSDREEEPNEYEDGEYFMSGSVAAYITELSEKAKISFTISTASFFKLGYCCQYFDDGADPPSEIKFTLTAYDSQGNILDVAQGSANTKSQGGTGLDYLTVEDAGAEIAYVIVGCPGGYWLIDNIETDAAGCVPPIADAGGPYKICKGGVLQLNGSASGGESPYTYLWGGTDAAKLSATDVANPTFDASVAGTFSVTLTVFGADDCESDPVQVNVTVNETPTATASNNGPVCVGSTLTLSGGPANMEGYSWTGPNDFVSSEQNPTVSISATTAMAGEYFLTVTDSNGCSGSTSTMVVVNTAPSITTQPESDTVCAGLTANFTVAATGTAPLSYQWYDGEGAIEGATDSSYETGVAGSYYCMVTNDCGSDTSNAVTLTVNTAPSITTQPESDTVCAGLKANFTVAATGTAPLSYQWYDGDGVIEDATDSSYETGVAGSYYCIVTNDCGFDTSSTVTLTVNIAPSITTQPEDQSVSEGLAATFTVEASGSAPLSYQWKISTDSGENWSDIVDANSSSYITPSVITADSGNQYKCVVSNACGNATSDAATLTVQSSIMVLKAASEADTIYVKPNSAFDIELWQENMSAAAAGFQAFFAFDSGLLSIAKGNIAITEEPFGMLIRKQVDGTKINIAAGIDLGTQDACDEDSLLATFTFTARETEGITQVNFRDNLPPTRFSDLSGHVIKAGLIDGPTIVIDGTLPQVSISADPSSWTNGDDVELTFSASDDYLDYYELSVNGSVVTPTPVSPYECDISGLGSGQYSASIAAYDLAGNEAFDEVTIFIDRTNPIISIVSAKQSGVQLIGGSNAGMGVVDIYVSAADVHSGLASAPSVTVTPDGSSAETATYVGVDEGVYHYTWTVSASTPNGVAKINASVSDDVGNIGNATEQTFNISKSRAVIEVKLLGVKEDVTREIKFVIGDGGTSDVLTFVEDVEFVFDEEIDEENSIGYATLNDIPVGTTWTEISAKDEQHTLRHKVELDVDQDVVYTASLELIGGDATNDNLIDILDFGVFFGKWGDHPEASSWPVLDADFSCNGMVWSEDFSFIEVYFLTFGDDEPVGPESDGLMSFQSMSAEDTGPRTAVSVTELAGIIGIEAALRADINGDGVVDKSDIKQFFAGLME